MIHETLTPENLIKIIKFLKPSDFDLVENDEGYREEIILHRNTILKNQLKISFEQFDEVKLIKDQLMKKEELFHPIIELAVRKKDLVNILTKYKPNIIHFIGHSNLDGKLKLKDDAEGKEDDISPDALSKTFKLLKEHLQCVFLNACYTDVLAEEIKKSTDCVIGMTRSIDDEVAPFIAEGFYIGIRNG